ncbi:MAG: succinylglutamate desuccinylase/aspartoacylase family protein [Patescibacteria group bacterium]
MNKKVIKIKNSKLEVFTTGSGRPRILIISGIHGDETVGPLFIKKLLKEVEKQKIPGTLTIIPEANREALKKNMRFLPGSIDLNRSFSLPASPTNRIRGLAKTIIKLCSGMDLVIDIHTLVRQNAVILGVLFPNGSNSVQRETQRLLRLSGPEAIWKVDRVKESWIKGSLTQACLERGVPAFGLELPDNRAVVNKLKNKLMRILSMRPKSLKNPGVYGRVQERAVGPGFFQPKAKPGDLVQKEQVLGIFNGSGQKRSIKATCNGTLLIVRQKCEVREKEPLFTIGVKVGAP